MDAKRLENIPLFAGLSRKERDQVARWADEIEVEAGYHLLDQGRLPHEFFVIEEGTVEVTQGGIHLTDLGPGDFFGEIAIVEHDRRTAAVVATTRLLAIVMSVPQFATMAEDMPTVAGRIHAAILERVARN
jgi:CRP-like cAMP-binding protein